MPKFENRLEIKGEYEIKVSNAGLISAKWKDTKGSVSKCHDGKITNTERENKQGTLEEIKYPKIFNLLQELSDQKANLYDIDRVFKVCCCNL